MTISPGANIAGCVRIGPGAYVGMGAIVIDRITVGAAAFVGAGQSRSGTSPQCPGHGTDGADGPHGGRAPLSPDNRMRKDFLVFGRPAIEEPEIAEVVAPCARAGSARDPAWPLRGDVPRVHGRPHAVALNSCTAALHLSMVAAGGPATR